MFASLIFDIALVIISLIGLTLAARARETAIALGCGLALLLSAIAGTISLSRDISMRETSSEAIVRSGVRATREVIASDPSPSVADVRGELPQIGDELRERNANLRIIKRECGLVISASSRPDIPFLGPKRSKRVVRINRDGCPIR